MRKLQALLNLANNAGTEGEAMAAMKRLTEMCHAHDVEMAEIAMDDDGDPTDNLEFAEEVAGRQTSGWYRWQKDLGNAVATATGTMSIYYGKTVLKFAGDAHDVAVAIAFWKQLQKTCRRLAREAIGKGWTSDHKSWAAGFAQGCWSKAIDDKEEIEEEMEENSPGGALVVYKNEKKDWLSKMSDKQDYGEASRPKVKNDKLLYLKGLREGRAQDMNPRNKIEAQNG
jgi:hypothetical protein